MRNIFMTGSSGFVGTNLQQQFKNIYSFNIYNKDLPLDINSEIVLHLAGKAHDLKNISNPTEYHLINTDFTIEIFNAFLNSPAELFIFISSVKAVADSLDSILTEEHLPCPITDYGKSKLNAEKYIFSKEIPINKRVYVLRPCMIHGPGNKGNLNLLYKLVGKGMPWPLGSFDNQRSFCSIDNFCFIIKELIENEKVPSGVYNVADDEPLSTNMIIDLISNSLNKKIQIWKIPQFIIKITAKLGDVFKLPLNSERLYKLTENYIVSNTKLKLAINKPLPLSSKDGIINTLNSFINI
jgi:nucleoside-diphosphate-sugar epimerase